jgi:hypothetical protein
MSKYGSLAKLQAAQLANGAVDSVGSVRDVNPDKIIMSQIHSLLKKFSDDVIADIEQSIDNKGLNASGNLKASVEPDIVEQGNNITKLKILMADYWEAAETGRKAGKMPPVESIMDWIANKGIKVGGLKGNRSLAWAIAKSIAKKGTMKRFNYKGSNFLSDVINDETLKEFNKAAAEITGLTVAYTIKNVFEPKY